MLFLFKIYYIEIVTCLYLIIKEYANIIFFFIEKERRIGCIKILEVFILIYKSLNLSFR